MAGKMESEYQGVSASLLLLGSPSNIHAEKQTRSSILTPEGELPLLSPVACTEHTSNLRKKIRPSPCVAFMHRTLSNYGRKYDLGRAQPVGTNRISATIDLPSVGFYIGCTEKK